MARFSVEDEEAAAAGVMKRKRTEGGGEDEEEEQQKQRGAGIEEEDPDWEGQVEEEEEEEEDSEEEEGEEGDGGGIKLSVDPDILDCSICFEPLRPPLFLCQNGHTTCSSCTKLSSKCHICSYPVSNIRCLTLEKAIESAKVSCSYARSGCRASISYIDKLIHESTCNYAPCFCPMPNCTFSGSTELLWTHIDAYHENSFVVFHFDEPFSTSLMLKEPLLILLEQQGDIFLLLNNSEAAIGNSVSIACIRPSSAKCDFKYELTAEQRGSSLQLKASTVDFKQWTGVYPDKVFLFVPPNFWASTGDIHLEVCIHRQEGDSPDL